MPDLKDKLIKLGSQEPELQKHLRPVLDRLSAIPPSGYPSPDIEGDKPDWTDPLRDLIERDIGIPIKSMKSDYAGTPLPQKLKVTLDVPATLEGFKSLLKRLVENTPYQQRHYEETIDRAKKDGRLLTSDVPLSNREIEEPMRGVESESEVRANELLNDGSNFYFEISMF